MRTSRSRDAAGDRRADPRGGDPHRQRGLRAEDWLDRRVVVPAIVVYMGVSVVGWYVNGFVVKPNELVRESPYIAHNIEMTRQAYRAESHRAGPFPAETGVGAVDAAQQSGDDSEHPAVGLARAPGHAPADSGNPHLLRLSRTSTSTAMR